MNTTEIGVLDRGNRGLDRPVGIWAPSVGRVSAGALPEWLPVPAIRQAGKVPASKPAKSSRLWEHAASAGPLRVENWFLALLAGGAVVGVAYGFSCLIDLVQNWALFNAGLEHLIQ